MEIAGKIVDVVGGTVLEGTVRVENGRIAEIREHPVEGDLWILPGLIDAHVHIESSMLIPSEFARLAVVHGTTGTVSDPHEIANVLGMEGVEFMIRNGRRVPFRFAFGAPSCVPATPFETAGASLGPAEVTRLLEMPEVKYLSEMMNFPGVLNGDPEVLSKLESAKRVGKPVDGHAPGITGPEAERYIQAGITTDHECYTLEEAKEKIRYGMKILIREGSAARNFEALWPLINEFPGQVMLCSDDKHPDDLLQGHLDVLIRRALIKGCDPMNVIRACTLNPIRHYNLPAGLLQQGDPADLLVVNNLREFRVLSVYVDGILVARDGKTLIPHADEKPSNRFHASTVTRDSLKIPWNGGPVRVIEAFDGQLVTGSLEFVPASRAGELACDPERDILKLVVKDRYTDRPPAVALVHGFGLRNGALASSVAHDSHNIVAVGADEDSLVHAINMVISVRGGIAVADGAQAEVMPLPFAGIMSGIDGFMVADRYSRLDALAHTLGSPLRAPFMTLSFMALLVIPALKLSDRGLFDGNKFSFTLLESV